MQENGQLAARALLALVWPVSSEMEQCVLVALCGLHLPPKCHLPPAPSITWPQICPIELELEIFGNVVLKWHKGNIFQFHISACFWLWSLKTCPWASSPLPGRAVQRPSRWRTEKGRPLCHAPPPKKYFGLQIPRTEERRSLKNCGKLDYWKGWFTHIVMTYVTPHYIQNCTIFQI